MRKYLYSSLLIVVLGSGLAQASGARSSPDDEVTLSTLNAQLKVLAGSVGSTTEESLSIIRQEATIEKEIKANIEKQLKSKPSLMTWMPDRDKKMVELKQRLSDNQAALEANNLSLLKLQPKIDSMTKIASVNANDPKAILASMDVIQTSNRAENASARNNALVAVAHSHMDEIERKIEKTDVGAYVRDKFAKFINSTDAACGMVDRCRVKEPTPLDPKVLDDVFPLTDKENIRPESYQNMRQKKSN